MPQRPRKLLFDALALAMFIALSLWLTRPWIAHPRTLSIGIAGPIVAGRMIPIGSPDVVMNMSFAGWLKFAALELHQWPLARTPYLMYPVGAGHGASFDGLLLAMTAALLACFMPLTAAYAIALLLGMILSGFVFYRLACRLWGRGALAFALGLNAAALPFIIQRLSIHPNLVYVWTIPAAIHLYLNFERKPTLKRAAAWGLSFPLLAMASWHILLIGLVFQGSAALITGARAVTRRDWARLRGVGAAWVIGSILVAVIAWPMLTHAGHRANRPMAELIQFSTPLLQHVMPYPYSFVGDIGWFARLQQRVGTHWEAWNGGPIASLLILLIYLRWARPRGPRGIIALAGLAALTISLGPILQVRHAAAGGQGVKLPLYYLLEKFPVCSIIHVPGRYGLLLHYLALLATGFFIQTLRERAKPGPRATDFAWPAAAWLVVGINLACTLGPYAVETSPNLPVSDFYKALGQKPGRGAILDVPISAYCFPQYNIYQFHHKRPAVSSVLFHDAVPPADAERLFGKPTMRFFSDFNRKSIGDGVLAEIIAHFFMDSLAEREIEFVAVHPRFLEFLNAAGLIDPQTPALYDRIEQAWLDRLVYKDDQVHVFRTGER